MARRSITVRSRVLAVIETAPDPLCGIQVAAIAGLTYKQTIDALNALHNLGKVSRDGRKFTARWTRPEVTTNHLADLEAVFFRSYRR